MIKFVQAFLTGIFFTFLLDFFLFLGMKLNYIDFHEIDVYYNIFFWDHQNIIIYLITSAVLGFIVTYIDNIKLSVTVLSLLSIMALSTLIQSVGYSVAEMLLMKKNVTLTDSRYNYSGDIYYEGREIITFYDYELQKIILLNKKDLKNDKN